jgi:predicted NUDIX family NTP pyrophosphohydrolase
MPQTSAGILVYRRRPQLEVFVGHMGGPFWSRKDAAAWSIPKGLFTDETAIDAARREFVEEIGTPPPADLTLLGEFRYSNKVLTVFAGEGDLEFVESNTFELEWPPASGRLQSFAEIDRAEWFTLDIARTKLVKGQVAVLDALVAATVGA